MSDSCSVGSRIINVVQGQNDVATKKVAICYHFFANYRRPVFVKLQEISANEYLFFADVQNRIMQGVPTIDIRTLKNFVECPYAVLPFGVVLQRGVISIAFRRDVDVIIYLADWKFLCTWVSAFFARMTGKTVLFWTHGWKQPERGFRGLLRRIFYRLSHGLLLYGESARKIGIDAGFTPDRLYVVNNSLDYDRHKILRSQITRGHLQSKRKELFGDNEAPIVICCSRLQESKQLDLLISTVACLNQDGFPMNLLLIGEGEARQRLEALAKVSHVNAVFLGACYDEEEISICTSLADVTVCPGAVGLTVIQSMTFGTPVITSDNFETQKPEVGAIIPGETGEFFDAGSVESLATTLREYFRKPEQERTRMSSCCLEIVDRYYTPTYQAAVIESAVRLQKAKGVDVTQPSHAHVQ